MNISKVLPESINMIIAKRKGRKLRIVMRTYRKLKSQGRMNQIHELRSALVEEQFNKITSKASKTMFGASIDSASLIVRQYAFIQILMKTRFAIAMLYSIGSGKPIRFPLPKEWQTKLIREGYRVDRFSCQLKFILFLFIYFCYGIYSTLLTFKSAIIQNRLSSDKLDLPFAYFSSLSHYNLPSEFSNSMFSQNIITWYTQWNDRDKNIKNFHHDAKNTNNLKFDDIYNVYYAPLKQLNIGGIRPLFGFLWWFIRALLICIKDLILFRWWTFLLFEQFVQAAILRYAAKKVIANDYLFHHSGVFFRPIWTYEVEKRDSRVILYFHSTNNEQHKKSDSYGDPGLAWNLSSWPLILVWDEYQEQFVKRVFHSYKEIKVVGDIWFSASNYENKINIGSKNKISAGLFDVQPHRAALYQVMAPPTDYYDGKVAIQFLKDVHKVLDSNSIEVFHKRKRDVGKTTNANYIFYLQSLTGENHISVDPKISANYLIKEVDFVISMPFTSTALLANYQNKPSIYYDPFGDVQKNDRAAHGIQVIVGIDELDYWVKSIKSQLKMLENNIKT